MSKECRVCREVKPLTDFARHTDCSDGRVGTCRVCRTAQARSRHLLRKYGVTEERYNQMFTAQAGRCAICHRHQAELTMRLAVDHNHTTGSVRGLLCQSCNLAIDYVQESCDVLEAAVRYLEGAA